MTQSSDHKKDSDERIVVYCWFYDMESDASPSAYLLLEDDAKLLKSRGSGSDYLAVAITREAFDALFFKGEAVFEQKEDSHTHVAQDVAAETPPAQAGSTAAKTSRSQSHDR